MGAAYKAADLVISRAGASSISEFCLIGKPVILVPSPNVAEDHQTKNAMALVNKDAAIYVKDADAPEVLLKKAVETVKDEAKLASLCENIKKLGLKNSAAEDDFKWSKVDSGIAVQNMAIAAESMGLGNLIIGCVYDALHGEKKAYFDKALAIPEGYSFQIALAVGHKTDNKTPHDYDVAAQVSYL